MSSGNDADPGDGQARRYFVTVYVPDQAQVGRVMWYGFDLFVVLPEPSVEGRTCRALKIAAGTGGNRRAVLFLGGVHAREIVNPDLLIRFAFDLCQSPPS